MTTLTFNSHQATELIDITQEIQIAVKSTGIEEGLAFVSTPHTTAAITINENADPDVRQDILMEINKLVPIENGYQHIEGNSAAHIKSSLFGSSETLIVNNGCVVLGTWQGIFLCEFDGPRRRHVHVQVIGR